MHVPTGRSSASWRELLRKRILRRRGKLYWLDAGLATARSAVVIFLLLTGMAYMTWFERRVIGRLQVRLGPNRVGPAGLLQPLADAIKLFFKEDIRPTGADWLLFP